MGINKRIKIVLSLVASLGLTLVITNTFFFAGLPKLNLEKVKRLPRDVGDNLTILKNTLAYNLSPDKVDYGKIFSDGGKDDFVDISPTVTPTMKPFITPTIFSATSPTPSVEPSPTQALTPTSSTQPTTPTPTPTVNMTTTVTPTIFQAPTVTPTSRQESTPTTQPQPTPTTTNNNALKISNPLNQPYYNPRLAYKCYNPSKFIEVYANGISSASCYSQVKSYVDSNLTSVSILGRSITVHKKAYPAFKAVSDELENNSVAKAYKINKIGAYVFRCNVNASTSDRNDLCNQGCVLSTHAFGISVDINWDENCNGCSSYTMPQEIVDVFESYGFRWGGRYQSIFGSKIDSMHFEYMYDLCKDTK